MHDRTLRIHLNSAQVKVPDLDCPSFSRQVPGWQCRTLSEIAASTE